MIDQLIARLDTVLQQKRPDYYAELQAGATDTELTALEHHLGMLLPEEFKTFYRWKNGARPEAGYPAAINDDLLDSYGLLPIAGIIEEWDIGNTLPVDDFGAKARDWWRREWVPFMASNQVELYCLDLDGAFGGTPGQIIEFIHDDMDRVILYPSFTHWLETLVTVYEQDLYAEHAEYGGYWHRENATYDALYARLNPGYPIIVDSY